MRTLELGVDPGGTTGIFEHRADGWLHSESDPLSFCDWAYWIRADLKLIVCERYVVTSDTLRKSRQYDALEVIGFLKWLAHDQEIPFVLQSPGDAKRFATDERLKAAGWYAKGYGHANDAARHLMLYKVKNGEMEPVRGS